jgi:hypothetical protein
MKYLKAFLIVMLTVFTFGSAIAQDSQRQSGHQSTQHRHYRHHRHHRQMSDQHVSDQH